MFELDRAMKILAARYPLVFYKLLFSDNPDVKFEKVEDSVINVAEHRSDKIFRFLENEQQKIVSFEFVTQPSKSDLFRFHAKNGLLSASYLVEVITVIVYLEKGDYRTFPNEYVAQIGRAITRTQFSRILLWEYQERIRSGEFKELAPLLVLFEEKPTEETILEEKALIKTVEDEREQSDLLAVAIMVAFRKFKDEIVKQLFHEEYIMLKESTFVKEWLEESWEKGLAEGFKRGEEEGRAEGRVEGLNKGLREGQIKIIVRQLQSILGRVDKELENRINSLCDLDVEKLSEALLRMRNTTDLEEWLRLREENNKN